MSSATAKIAQKSDVTTSFDFGEVSNERAKIITKTRTPTNAAKEATKGRRDELEILLWLYEYSSRPSFVSNCSIPCFAIPTTSCPFHLQQPQVFGRSAVDNVGCNTPRPNCRRRCVPRHGDYSKSVYDKPDECGKNHGANKEFFQLHRRCVKRPNSWCWRRRRPPRRGGKTTTTTTVPLLQRRRHNHLFPPPRSVNDLSNNYKPFPIC